MRTVLEMFSSVFSFYKIKVIVNENVSITDHASGIRLPNWSKFAINWKNDSDIRRHCQVFWRCHVSLVIFSYWSKFYVNIVSGSGVLTTFVCKRLTRDPKIGNTFVWVFLNIRRLGRVRDTKCDINVSNKKLLNPSKCQGYSSYRFWIIKGNPITPLSKGGSYKISLCVCLSVSSTFFWGMGH